MLGFVSAKTVPRNMHVLLCLVAVAELRHVEMVCARFCPVLYVNMYICKMYICIHRSR